jgi:hypothetical protein
MSIQELINQLQTARPDNSQVEIEFIAMAQDRTDDEILTEVKRIESHHPTKVTIWLS